MFWDIAGRAPSYLVICVCNRATRSWPDPVAIQSTRFSQPQIASTDFCIIRPSASHHLCQINLRLLNKTNSCARYSRRPRSSIKNIKVGKHSKVMTGSNAAVSALNRTKVKNYENISQSFHALDLHTSPFFGNFVKRAENFLMLKFRAVRKAALGNATSGKIVKIQQTSCMDGPVCPEAPTKTPSVVVFVRVPPLRLRRPDFWGLEELRNDEGTPWT